MCVILSWETHLTHLTEMQKFPGLVRHPRITNSPTCLFIRNSTASPRVASSRNHLQKQVLCSWLSDANMQVHTPTSQCCKSKTILPLGLSCTILTSKFGLFKTLNELLSSKVWKCWDFSGTFVLLKENVQLTLGHLLHSCFVVILNGLHTEWKGFLLLQQIIVHLFLTLENECQGSYVAQAPPVHSSLLYTRCCHNV